MDAERLMFFLWQVDPMGTCCNVNEGMEDDVLLYKAAALVKVRQAVAARTKDAVERKRLFTALKSDQWLT